MVGRLVPAGAWVPCSLLLAPACPLATRMLCWVSSVRVTCPSCLWHSRTSFLGLGEMCRNADRAEKETGQCIPKNSFYSQHLLLPRTAQPQTTSAGQAPQSWTFRIAAPVRVCHHREQHSQCRLLLSTCWSKLTPRGSMGSPTAPECEEPKCPLCHNVLVESYKSSFHCRLKQHQR